MAAFWYMAMEEGTVIKREKDKPVYRNCGISILAEGSNTSNLFQHLRNCHPQLYADLGLPVSKSKDGNDSQHSQPTLIASILRLTKYTANSNQA